MKRSYLLFPVLLISGWTFAQNIEPLIKAERDFEKACLEKGIRAGFLSFADSAGIMFGEKGPENAKLFWQSLPPLDAVFSWSPTFGEMSLSGDWGYTTGNYEHRPKSLTDKPDRFGQYTTVWQKDGDGTWKYLIDIGNSHPSAALNKTTMKLETEKTSAGKQASDSFLMDLEKDFVAAFEIKPADAYRQYISSGYILNLSGFNPILNRDTAVMRTVSISSPIKYRPLGGKLAPGKDMAAVYGTITCGNGTGNYVRIWRHEKGGWKIALEVINI